jgi:RNA polymerase sigma-70 factor (ECF subfamily)
LFSEKFLQDLAEWEGNQPSEDADRRLAALRACMERLKEHDRRLIELRYGGALGIGGIARQLGRTPQSICNSLGRIRGALFECIQRTLATEGRP